MTKKTKTVFENEIGAQISGIGIHKNDIGLGFSIARDAIEDQVAIELFVASQLRIRLECDPASGKQETKGQGKLIDTAESVEFIGEVKKISIAKKSISGQISVVGTAIDTEKLIKFAYKGVTLHCDKMGDAGDDAEGEASDTE